VAILNASGNSTAGSRSKLAPVGTTLAAELPTSRVFTDQTRQNQEREAIERAVTKTVRLLICDDLSG